ncbi:MAG: hypothetical protein WB245_03140 [Acidimicrobiia bacterium]
MTESPDRALIKSLGRRGTVASLTAVVFLVAVLLVACTDAGSGGEATSTTRGVDEPSATTTTTTTETTTSTAPVEVTVTTTEDFVRFIHPDEWTLVRSQCMIDKGWPVTTTPDGGISYTHIGEDQQPEMQADDELCGRMFPVDPKYRQPLTVEQLTFLYDWFVNESIPCLEAEGYTNFDPPSLDVFIDTYDTEGWSPYRDLNTDQLGPGAWYALQEACPQGPPVDGLFGS